MITGLLTALASNVAMGWIGRRVGEIAALVATIAPVFLSLPPAYQDAFWEILQGRGGELTLATYVGIIGYVFAQWRSWRATVKPQVVTNTGKKVELPVLTEEDAKDMVERNTGVRPTHIPSRVK